MSKKHRKISLVFIGFLLTLLTIVSFAEAPEAPNQLITENPYKEVKTVEANKNREHAEMKISVNKLNPKAISGYKINDNEFYIELPSDEILKENETYYISKNIEDLPNIYTINGKKTITNLKRFENYSIETADFNYGILENIILINKAPFGINEFIVSKLDKLSGEIKKVYKIEKFNSVVEKELQGEIINNNTQVVFKLTDELLNDFMGNEKQIKIGKSLKDILDKKSRIKRSLDKNTLNYELDKENKKLIIDNANILEDLKILVLNNNKIEKIYRGKRNVKLVSKTVLPTENFNIPEDDYGTRRMYINQEFGQGARVKKIIFDGEEHKKIRFPREHYAKGNIVFITNEAPADYDSGNPYIRIIRVGGYVPKITTYEVKVELEKDRNIIEKTFIITEYPQKTILEKPLEDYAIGEDLIKEENVYYVDTLNLEEFIENQKASWRTYLGLEKVLPHGWYRKLNLFKRENKIIKEPNLYGELKTLGFKGVKIGGYAGDTKVIGETTGTYKIFFSRQSIGKIKVELDGRIINTAKNNFNLSNLVGGTHLTNNLTNWLNDGSLKADYSEMTKVIDTLNSPVPICQYVTYTGRNILSQDNRKQLFTNRRDNNKGLALPIGNIGGHRILNGFSINLSDFIRGDRENAIFTYKGNDNKNYSGEIEVLVGMQDKLIGKGIIDLTNFSENQMHIFPRIGNNSITSDKGLILKNLVGNLPDTTSLKNKSILNNICFKVQSKEINFEKVKGEINGRYPQEVILDDNKLPFKIGLSDDGALKVEKLRDENFEYTIEMKYRYNEVILGSFNIVLKNTVLKSKYEANIYYDLNNAALIEAAGSSFYGWNLIYPTSNIDNNAVVGIVDSSNNIVNDNRKNNQFKALKATGKTSALKESDLGKKIKITVGNKTQEVTLYSGNSNSNALDYKSFNLDGLTVQIDYESVAQYNGAMYFAFSNWDKEAKNFTIKVEFSDRINIYNVTIPEFNGEVYYNKNIPQIAPTEVNYPTKTLRGRFIREHSGEMGIKFNVGTKDYDLRILGQYNGNTNLKLKIPKQVTLKVRDDLGVEKEIPFYTEILTLNSGVKGENSNYYCIFAPNDGINNNSEINATIVLKTLFKNSNVSWNYITGENLNLVSIGANSTSREKKFTIIDNVDLKMELANFNETIDVSNVNISQKVYSKNGYYGLIQNENKLILKDGSRKILETTFEELTKRKKEILEAGISIKYNYGTVQDINRNQFEFEKIKGVNYNKTLRLEVHTSNGQLLYYIDFNIINKVGFEILPGKGKLDFGGFFPGDVKRAESLIEFKNPNNANINISLSPTNNYKMFKKGASISPNTTILLNDLQIKDLKKGANSTNNFKISGIATTTKDTLPGEYSGELDVIITIVP